MEEVITNKSKDIFFANFKRVFIAIAIVSFFVNILSLASPLFMLQVYDRVLTSRSPETLFLLLLLIIFAIFFMSFLDYLRNLLLPRIAILYEKNSSEKIFQAGIDLSLLNKKSSSYQGLRDLLQVRKFMSSNGPSAILDTPWVVIFISIVWILHWSLGVIVLISALLLFSISFLNEYATTELLKKSTKEMEISKSFARAVFDNAELTQALGMRTRMNSKWKQNHDTAAQSSLIASDRLNFSSAITKTIRLSSQLIIMAFGALLVIDQHITPGMMIAASIIASRALLPVEQVIKQWRNIKETYMSFRRSMEIITGIEDDKNQFDFPRPIGHLSVENLFVSISQKRKPFLKRISFNLLPGEILAIQGNSGSGKTLLARTLVGINKFRNGNIRLDNVEISQWSEAQWGQYIGYLPQITELFSGSIAQNISRFEIDANSSEIVNAAKAAHAHEFILGLTNGYETQVGENGHNLSVGQYQRIGLARALYGKPIFLLLDEPNANLDKAGEKALADSLIDMKKNKQTVIIITHRSQVLKNVDRILTIGSGRIQSIEDGKQITNKHSELITPLPVSQS